MLLFNYLYIFFLLIYQSFIFLNFYHRNYFDCKLNFIFLKDYLFLIFLLIYQSFLFLNFYYRYYLDYKLNSLFL
jgi:hypothetical protein